MLIVLPKAEYLPALEAVADDPAFAAFAAFVETMADVLKAGWHAVRSAPLVLEKLSAWPTLGAAQRNALVTAARAVTLGALPFGEASDALVITGPAGAVATPPEGVRWHRRPWQRFTTFDVVQKAALVGENLDDARWYRWLARAHGRRLMPRSARPLAPLALEIHGAGGSTAAKEVPAQLDAGRPTLCVLDSDRDRPGATAGTTVSHLDRALERRARERGDGDPPARHHTIAARDVENTLPLALAEAVGSGAEWLDPMAARGFFVGPGRPLDPVLAWLDVGKDQCAARLVDVRDPTSGALRQRAVEQLRGIQAEVGRCDGAPPSCAGRDGDGKWGAVPAGCRLVFSVGKALLPGAVTHLDARAAGGVAEHRATVDWLVSILPGPDEAPEDPSRVAGHLAWSWGLRMPPALP